MATDVLAFTFSFLVRIFYRNKQLNKTSRSNGDEKQITSFKGALRPD